MARKLTQAEIDRIKALAKGGRWAMPTEPIDLQAIRRKVFRLLFPPRPTALNSSLTAHRVSQGMSQTAHNEPGQGNLKAGRRSPEMAPDLPKPD